MAIRQIISLALASLCACGSSAPAPTPPVSPRAIPAASSIAQLVISRGGSCGVLADHRTYCWGRWANQLLDVSVPAQGVTDVAELAIGYDVVGGSQQRYEHHFCVRDLRGGVRCWGNGHQGQLGVAGGEQADVPVAIEPLPPAAGLALGAHHSCALSTTGEVWCWGSNEYGQLGIGHGPDARVRTPAKVALPGKAIQLVASSMDTCAILDDHEVYCWGENLRGEAGASNRELRIAWTPHHATRANGSRQLAASDSTFCAVKLDGALTCWGYITDKLGPAFDASTAGDAPLTDVRAAAVGYSHVCAIRNDDSLWCLGTNDTGQLGDAGDNAWTPRKVALPGGAAQVVANKGNTCVRLADNRWYCWGANRGAEIGPRAQAQLASPAALDLQRID